MFSVSQLEEPYILTLLRLSRARALNRAVAPRPCVRGRLAAEVLLSGAGPKGEGCGDHGLDGLSTKKKGLGFLLLHGGTFESFPDCLKEEVA